MIIRKKRGKVGQYFYRLAYRMGEYSLRGFVVISPRLPRSFLSVFTKAAAHVTFVLFWRYRRRMEENLSTVMGDEFRTREERRAIVRRAWRNFAQGMYETSCALSLPKEKICTMVAFDGEEHLKQALAKGKGVIALSAHLGNFTMVGTRLAAAGYPFSVVVKQPKDERFARLIDGYRLRVGVKTISARPRRKTARRILEALRKNEVVLLIADEFKSRGVEVEFLGRTAPAPRGPVTLALRSGAPLIPMFVVRDTEDRLTLHVEPEIEMVRTGDTQEDVARNVGLSVRQLELMIRRYPDQWNWLGFRSNGGSPISKENPSGSPSQVNKTVPPLN
jgi:KDO2-lipid IV(A) lauroyltransferase